MLTVMKGSSTSHCDESACILQSRLSTHTTEVDSSDRLGSIGKAEVDLPCLDVRRSHRQGGQDRRERKQRLDDHRVGYRCMCCVVDGIRGGRWGVDVG